jgi:membrane protein
VSSRAPQTQAPPLPSGSTARTLDPILGAALDPPDVDTPLVSAVVDRWDLAAWLWRWWERFRDGRGTLSAKGIAFYSFFGVLSGLVLAFTVATQIPRYEALLTEIIEQALPGIVGPGGIEPDQLRAAGATLGTVGGLVLLYAALGIVRALEDGVRLVYGVQYEPRRFVTKNLRYLGYLLLLSPVLAVSYLASSVTAGLFRPLLASFGISGPLADLLVAVAGYAVATGANAVVIVVILSRLGGIRPRTWRWRAAFLGGAVLSLVHWGAALLVAFTVANPRYLSFGLPVSMLLLFYTMSVVILATAAFVATANEPGPVLAARRRQLPVTPQPPG